LRSVDYRDSDRILTLLTDRFGKVACLARGARRSKKRFGGVIQPFSVLRVSVEDRRSSMPVLLGAEIDFYPARISADLDRMAAGYAALELLRELTAEHAPDAQVMELAISMMRALDEPRAGSPKAWPHALLLAFETRLLVLAGFSPMLDACGYCGKQPSAQRSACFDPAEGHLVCTECGGAPLKLSGPVRSALMVAASGALAQAADLLEGASLPDAASAARQSAQRAIRALTQHRLGRELDVELTQLGQEPNE
jgi:DNA repair protein RecO (recombination protein O)